jgi:uridine phosphorylase
VTTDNLEGMPLLWDTTDAPSAFDPDDWFEYCTTVNGRSKPQVPGLAVQSVINAPLISVHLDLVKERYGAEADDFTLADHPFAVFQAGGQSVVLATSSKGSYSAGGLDELIALGAQKIIVLNVGAALSDRVGVGSFVVASKALREDGVSFHYQAGSRYNEPSPALSEELALAARGLGTTVHEGPVWTNNAHFRLSLPRLKAYRDEGCLALENEVASAFAVGHLRDVEVATLTYIGLSLAENRFAVPPRSVLYGPQQSERHFDAALAALVGGLSPGAAEKRRT